MSPIIKTAESVVQVSFNGHWTNQHGISTVCHWHYDVTAPSAADLLTFLGVVTDAWQTRIVPQHSNNYTFDGSTAIDIDSPTQGNSVSKPPNQTKPLGGAQSGAYAGPGQCAVVRKITSGGGRGARSGRMFLPAVAANEMNEDGIIVPARKSSLAADCTAWYSDIDSFTSSSTLWTFVVPSWRSANKPPPSGGTWPATAIADVGALQVQDLIGSQRRRIR